jgi:hypothetical protein
MRYSCIYLIVIALAIILGCQQNIQPADPQPIKKDSVVTVKETDLPRLRDTIILGIKDSSSHRCDSLQNIIDSLTSKLFVSNYKLERVRYYLKICLRNPSQDKFLKGWIKRAIQ